MFPRKVDSKQIELPIYENVIEKFGEVVMSHTYVVAALVSNMEKIKPRPVQQQLFLKYQRILLS